MWCTACTTTPTVEPMERKAYDWLLVQPTSSHENLAAIEQAVRERYAGRFKLVGYRVDDWDEELSPWTAPAVFGKKDFGSGADATLQRLVDEVLPPLRGEAERLCIGGYSMAGLFALYAAMHCDRFDAVCAVSPSVWFPGWMEHAEAHPVRARRAYLSLGDREHRSRHPLIQRVHDCVQRQHDLLPCEKQLDWNPGTHFTDPEGRMARGYLWVMGADRS